MVQVHNSHSGIDSNSIPSGGLNALPTSPNNSSGVPLNYTSEQLWDAMKAKEAMIHSLQQKLTHYRLWLAGVHARVQQMSPNLIKNARRIYVGGLDEGFTDEDMLKNVISEYMMSRGGATHPGNPILSCKITPEKGYAFIELRSVEEATNVLAFDGIAFQDIHLKIRRPSNYDPVSALMLGPTTPDPTVDNSSLDICRSVVEDTPNKLFIGGLPCDWNEDQVKELLIPLGTLKSFNLVMDKVTGKSKGYAFCQFDEGATDYVIAALNQKKVGNKILTVKRALEGQKQGGSNVLMPNGMPATQNQPPPIPEHQEDQNLMNSMFSGKNGGYDSGNMMGGMSDMQGGQIQRVRSKGLELGGMQKRMNGNPINDHMHGIHNNNMNNNNQGQYNMNSGNPGGGHLGMGAGNTMW
eukprot:TRINITY_DN7553_c3_g1_i1.p1 TRINITY_DN7553_c3_g1~~TRINITY_DN7553_c3_g1_i1.p1  ORF type:complete len:409 (+),score=68.79 TRINITY_DN7553_c3_g1_i1:352-1578(+)